MKVFAVNSSPRRERGGTAFVLTPFLDGMRQAGAEVELVYLQDLNIQPCLGCYTCWTRTPGRCARNDDMAALLPKLESETVVLATPLYVDGMNGPMKTFLDRSIPLLEPTVELRAGHCRHPRRARGVTGRLVLVSACGFTELDNFDLLVAHVSAICRNMGREFSGALLRPYAAILPSLRRSAAVEDVVAACRNAGRELVESGKMSPVTLAAVSREVITREQHIEGMNSYFRSRIVRAKQA